MPNPLVISIQVETTGANSQITGLNKSLGGIGASTERGSRQATQSLNSLERSASRSAITIRNQFSALGGVIQAAVGVGFAQAAKSAVQVAANFQLAELGIASFVKAGEDAKGTFDNLKAFALTSPLEFSTILEASNQLLAYDFAAKDLIPTLRTLSTAMFAVTGGKDVPDKLKDVIRALGQIKAVGALTGEEMRQLQNAAIVTRKELADAFGVSVAQFNKAIADRAVAAKDVIEITLEAAEAKFGKFGVTIEQSAAVAFSNFKDALGQAADVAIRDYLPDIVAAMDKLTEAIRGVSKAIKENRGFVEGFVETAGRLGAAAITYGGLALAIDKVRAAAVALAGAFNPLLLIPATLAALIPEIVELIDRINNTISFRNILRSPKDVPRYDDFAKEISTVVSNRAKQATRAIAEEYTGVFNFADANLVKMGAKLREFQKGDEQAREHARKVEEEEKRAHEFLLQAQRREYTGLADIIATWITYRKEIKLSAQAVQELNQATILLLATEANKELRKVSGARVEQLQDELDDMLKYETERFKARQEFEKETIDLGLETSRTLLENQENLAISRKDAELRQLDLLNAQTVEQRIAVENQRAQIEIDYLQQSLTRKARNLDLELAGEIALVEAVARVRGAAEEAKLRNRLLKAGKSEQEIVGAIATLRENSEEDIAARREALQRRSLANVKAIAEDTEAAISAARENAAIRSIQEIQSNNLRVFEGLKRNVEGLFDAVVTRSKSFGEAIADAIKLPILAAFKEIVSTRIAAMLFEIFGGGRVGIGQGGQPSFSGGGLSVNTRGSNFLGRLMGLGGAGALGFGGIPGAPGGTSGFSGPVQSIPGLVGVGTQGGQLVIPGLGGAAGSSTGVKGIGAALSGAAGSLKGILASLGNLGRGGAVLGPGSNGGALAQSGVGGAAGGALLLGGGTLAALGLRRGGLSGLGMNIAGGALAGAKFGVAGALIGAGIGAVAGTIRLFIKGAEEKIVEKVKAAYGITISKSFARDPLLGIIKQTFGGDINVGIQSQQVRDLIELYAMSTGQSIGSLPRVKPISSGFSLSGGGLSQLPSFSNGQPLSLGQLPGTSNPTPQPVVVQLDPDATTAFLQGQAVESINNNPRVVQGAVISASRQNAGRRQSLALAINPGVLL